MGLLYHLRRGSDATHTGIRTITSFREHAFLAAIFLFALLVRLAAIEVVVGFHTAAGSEFDSDGSLYFAIVKNLLAGRGYSLDGPTALMPPGYVFFLSGLYWLFGTPVAIRLIQALMGAGDCVLIFMIGQRLFNCRVGLLAAGILSIDPLLVYLTGAHLSENLFLFILLLIILQSLRVVEQPTSLATVELGVLIAVAVLTRSLFLGFVPFLIAWCLCVWGVTDIRTYRTLALLVASMVLVIAPWTIRNYAVYGAIVPVQNVGGMLFWAGNNPHSDGQAVWPTAETWTATRPPDNGRYGWRDLTYSEENRLYFRTALAWIHAHPGAYVRLAAKKLLRLYDYTRAADKRGFRVPLAVRVFDRALLVSALVGLILTLRDWRKLFLILSLVLLTNITAIVFVGATRYIVPMLPSLILLAAFAWVTCADYVVARVIGLHRCADPSARMNQ